MTISTVLKQVLLALFLAMALISQTAKADPIFWTMQGFKTDFEKSSVELARILSGGIGKDGIPSIDEPVFQPVSGSKNLADTEPVVSLAIGGDARAYPLQILTWHEIVNDEVGGVPVSVTYCPLCNSAPVFKRLVDGQLLDFGTTGKLKDSNLIMYDRQTESWWQQFTGEAIVGELTGKTLELVPARLESWADFKRAHPDGKVLVPNDKNMRDYGRNPYKGYDSAAAPFLYDGQLPENINPMERVVIIPRPDDGGKPIIITMKSVEAGETTAIRGYDLGWSSGQNSALDTGRIESGRDVGTITVQKGGADVAYDITFAFVAHAFHPENAIIGK